jgi:hypothetical protein
MEAKKRSAVSSAVSQRPVVPSSGYAAGKRPPASVQVRMPRMTNRLGLIWMGMPQT